MLRCNEAGQIPSERRPERATARRKRLANVTFGQPIVSGSLSTIAASLLADAWVTVDERFGCLMEPSPHSNVLVTITVDNLVVLHYLAIDGRSPF